MREIKFRAWDRKKNVMMGWDWLEEKQGTYLNSKYFHAMQYTGFKDKNGKEIYEGDIIDMFHFLLTEEQKDDVRYCEVSFYNGSYHLVGHGKKLTYIFNIYSPGKSEDTMCYEVVGNIHENPKLIKTI